jgi:hypothetical protein
LVTLLVLALAYPVGANVFLSAGGVKKLFEHTDSVKVDYRRAWSFWPGRVHVDDIKVTVKDRNVQFVLTIPRVDVTLSLRELLHRTFHATRVRGEGLSFRFRHRIEPESAGLPFVRALPPVPPFADPPLRETGPPKPPLDEAHYNLWTVHIEDVDVGVREVWAQMFRYEGTARALGAFRLRPAKRIWVGPAELRMEGGTLASGPEQAASSIRGSITCKVDDFDTEAVHGMEPFHFISARTKLELEVPNLAAVDFLAGPQASFALEDGSGAIDVDAALDHGVFTGDTRLAYRTSHLGFATRSVKFQLDGDLTLSAEGPTAQGPPRVSLALPAGELRFEGARGPPIELRDAGATVASSSADVTEPWSFDGPNAELTAVFGDLRSLGDVPGARSFPLRFVRGRGEAHLAMTTTADRGPRGRFEVDLHEVVAERGAMQFMAASLMSRGALSLEGVSGHVRIEGVRAGEPLGCPWTKVGAIALEGRLRRGARGRFETDVEGRVERASFQWGSFRVGAPRTALWGSWDGGRLSTELRADALDLRSAGGAPKGWEAGIGTTFLSADLQVSGDEVRGPARVEVKRLMGQVGNTPLEGDLYGTLRLASGDPSHRAGDVSGLVQARRVALRAGTHDVRDYWADLDLREVHIDTRQNLDLTGVMNARFRDALPALYVLASEDQIPDWAPHLLPLNSLAIDLRLERFCHFTDVQLLEARGGPLRATGRIQAQPGDTRGALLIQLAGLSPVSFGLEFGEGYSHGAPFVGTGWLEERLAPLMRAASGKRDERCPPESPSCD